MFKYIYIKLFDFSVAILRYSPGIDVIMQIIIV